MNTAKSTLLSFGLVALLVSGCASFKDSFKPSNITLADYQRVTDNSILETQVPAIGSILDSVQGTADVLSRFKEPTRVIRVDAVNTYYDYAGVLVDTTSGTPVFLRQGDFYPGSHHLLLHFKNYHLVDFFLADFKRTS